MSAWWYDFLSSFTDGSWVRTWTSTLSMVSQSIAHCSTLHCLLCVNAQKIWCWSVFLENQYHPFPILRPLNSLQPEVQMDSLCLHIYMGIIVHGFTLWIGLQLLEKWAKAILKWNLWLILSCKHKDPSQGHCDNGDSRRSMEKIPEQNHQPSMECELQAKNY